MIDAQRDFKYQVDEFYIGGDDSDEEDEDDDGPSPQIALRF
jgi:hypothetical protein